MSYAAVYLPRVIEESVFAPAVCRLVKLGVATSHDRFPPNGGLVWFSKGDPLISGKSRLVKYYNLAIWPDVVQTHWDYTGVLSTWVLGTFLIKMILLRRG